MPVPAARAALVRRAAPLAAASALLLLTACEHTPEEQAQRLLVQRAREHNAAVGAAVGALLVVAAQLLRYATTSPDRRRWPPRPARLPRLLVATMVAAQVSGVLVLAGVAAGVGYFAGPIPVPDVGFDGLAILVVSATLLPFGVLLAALAVALLAVAPRLPHVRSGTMLLCAFGHGALVAPGLLLGGNATPDAWSFGGWLLLCATGVAAFGYAYGWFVRRRTARARGLVR